MRSENFIAKSYFLPFEGPAFLSVSIWGMKLCMLVKQKHVPHDRKRMVGIHGEIVENERENLITSSRELMEVFALVLHDFSMESHHSFSMMGNL